MNKHTVNLFVDPASWKSDEGMATVNVVWHVEFNRELDKFLNKRKYQHDFSLLKEGIGRLTITYPNNNSHTQDDNLAYVEALAAKHIVSNTGINAFGFTDDKMSVRRDHLHFKFSRETALKLICRRDVEIGFFADMASIAAKAGTSAGYLYLATGEVSKDVTWAEAYLSGDNVDYYNLAADLDIRNNDNVMTSFGEMAIDYRSVDEFYSSEWVEYNVNVKNVEYPRPFATLYDIVAASNEIIYQDNSYLDKIRAKFGPECLLLANPEEVSFLPITKLASSIYYVLGYRKYINPLTLEEMHKNGIGLHRKQTLTQEELADLRASKQ